MQVVLTQKDADWVANYIRNKMKDLEENYTDLQKDSFDSIEKAQALTKAFQLENDKDIAEKLQALKDSNSKTLEEAEKTYIEEKRNLEKIIELMMIGSQ